MMFLIRMAFWASIVLVLLPTGKPAEPQAADARTQVSATEAVSAAASTVSDMRQFCARQPDACAIGAQAAAVFSERAQAGAKMVYEFLSEKASSPIAKASVRAKPQDTLTSDDRAPAWRGPSARREHIPGA
jgi:hypothetical protein